jgi:hypothetical protein
VLSSILRGFYLTRLTLPSTSLFFLALHSERRVGCAMEHT